MLFRSAEVVATGATDDRGAFRLHTLPAGTYYLWAGHSYYPQVSERSQAEPLKVVPGETVDVRMVLDYETPPVRPADTPTEKSIGGRLVDEFGDPAPDVMVTILRQAFVGGAVRFVPTSSGAPTNDLGEYRLVEAPPGEYFVSALSGPFNVAGGPAGAGFALTFYPGTIVPLDAQPVRIPAKGEPDPVNFALVPSVLAKASGRVVDPDRQPARRASMLLFPLYNDDLVFATTIRTTADVNGAYEFKNLPAGTYAIQALGERGFASQKVVVAGGDFVMPDMVTAPAAAVRGRLVFEGVPDPAALKQTLILARSVGIVNGWAGQGPRASLNPDLTFEIFPVVGPNQLFVGVPAPWMVAAILRRGEDVTDRVIDSKDGDLNDLEVLLTPRSTSVAFKVSDIAAKPVTSGVVLIVPDDARRWTYPSRYVSAAIADGKGEFAAYGLPPGVYWAVPFERVPRLDWMSPEFLQTLRGRGEQFTINYGDAITVRLVLRK